MAKEKKNSKNSQNSKKQLQHNKKAKPQKE